MTHRKTVIGALICLLLLSGFFSGFGTPPLTRAEDDGSTKVIINGFENELESDGWQAYYVNIGSNGGSGLISVNRDPDYIKEGDGSLKIDYDFQTKPLTGTVSIETGKTGNIQLSGRPVAIGFWVYGDGNGGWLRIQMAGNIAASIWLGDESETRVDWTGWKYISIEIPDTAAYPYIIQRAPRFIGTTGIANNRKGTVYIDSLCAVYIEPGNVRHTVTFKDYDGTVLSTQAVKDGEAAAAPASPQREGFTFVGWSARFDIITKDTVITAVYSVRTFKVEFKDYDGTVLKTDTVDNGSGATPPESPSRKGYTFIGWDCEFDSVSENMVVTAVYDKAGGCNSSVGYGSLAGCFCAVLLCFFTAKKRSEAVKA